MSGNSISLPWRGEGLLFETARLVLRYATPHDVVPLHRLIFADVDVMRHLFAGKTMTRDEVADVVADHFAKPGDRLGLAIIACKSEPADDVTGFAGLLACDALDGRDAEIGFALARSAWGQGYATEIGDGQLAYGFDALDYGRLLGLVKPGNDTSAHTLAKLGMTFAKRHDDVSGRGPRDVYALMRQDWVTRGSVSGTSVLPPL